MESEDRDTRRSPRENKTVEDALLEGGSERTHAILREYSYLFSKLRECR